MLRVWSRYCKLFASERYIHLTRVCLNENPDDKKKNSKRKVKEKVVLINLIDTDGKILGLKSKTESEKLALKMNVSLRMVEDATCGRAYASYMLTRSSDLFKMMGAVKSSTSQKKVKKLPLNSKILDHDLQIKYKTIEKWLSKNHDVHIVIASSNDTERMRESLFKKLEAHFKDNSRIIDIKRSENDFRFIMLPPKKSVIGTNEISEQC